MKKRYMSTKEKKIFVFFLSFFRLLYRWCVTFAGLKDKYLQIRRYMIENSVLEYPSKFWIGKMTFYVLTATFRYQND